MDDRPFWFHIGSSTPPSHSIACQYRNGTFCLPTTLTVSALGTGEERSSIACLRNPLPLLHPRRYRQRRKCLACYLNDWPEWMAEVKIEKSLMMPTICRFPARHSRQKVQARSTVPFAVKLLQGFQVDGTWNVPTTFTFVGCDLREINSNLKGKGKPIEPIHHPQGSLLLPGVPVFPSRRISA